MRLNNKDIYFAYMKGEQGTRRYTVNETITAAPEGARVGDEIANGGAAVLTIGGVELSNGDYAQITALDPLELDAATKGNFRADPTPLIGSEMKILTASGWDRETKTQFVGGMALDTSMRNEIDVFAESVVEWGDCVVRGISEAANGITFKCETIPTNDLFFRVVSTGVVYAN